MNFDQQQSNASPEIKNLIKYMRATSSSGIKTKVGVFNGKRLDYFKGKAAIKALLSPSYSKLKHVPPQPRTEAEAIAFLTSLLPYAFFLLVDRSSSSSPPSKAKSPSGAPIPNPKLLTINNLQQFKSDGYFAWFYEGSQLMTYLGGLGMVALMLAGVMFPLWPPTMRLGVWYLSILVLALLGALFVLAIVRLVIYVFTVFLAPPGLWIFPQLFADVGFIESFIPLYEWDYPKKKSKSKSKESSGEKKSKRSSEKALNGGGSEEANGVSPVSKGPTIEEVEDDED